MKRTKIILNPIAGRGRGARVEPELRSLLKSEGIDFDLVRTAGPWHAVELAERAVSDGFEPIVAAGGDGTMHEVVNGLMAASDAGETGTLGIIPIGSGSDFAHTVGVPPNLRAACQQLAHGHERVVDVGQITMPGQGTRYFDNTLGIGFDAVVTVEALKVKWLRGMALYLPVVLKTVFLSLKVPRATIEYDGQALTLPALMICVANGPREGGGFFVAPQAQPDDGLFDLCITREVSRLAQLGLIPHFIKGTHLDLEPVTMARARRVTLSSPDDLVAHVYDVTYGVVKPTDNLVIIDDSIVRGTTLKKSIIKILNRLGPKKIIVVSSAPQIRYPDCYGIDMARIEEFIAFKATLELLKETGQSNVIDDVYEKCKANEDNPSPENYVKEFYAPFTADQISDKIAEMLKTDEISAEVDIIFQSIENLHKACPGNTGDWYFTGNFPTPGGMRVVNRAFVNFYEGKKERAY